MKDFFQWFSSYPVWVRVAVLLFQAASVVLLVFFRGETPLGSEQKTSPPKENVPGPAPTNDKLPEYPKVETGLSHDETRRCPALTATFADGVRGMIEFTVRIQPIADKVPWIVANFASPEEAEHQVMAFLEGKLRDELVKYSFSEAQAKRQSIAANVITSAKTDIGERFWYQLHDVIVGEIWQAN